MFTRLYFYYCGPAGTRTLDPLIKSQLLYQLSYKTGTVKV
jgi:hypothetical protein